MRKIIILSILITIVFSCSTKKDIVYIQNSVNESLNPVDYTDYILRVDDVLKIDIVSDYPESALTLVPDANNGFTRSRESMIFDGYKVSTNGNISFPSLGEIKAVGLTVEQLKEKLSSNLVENGILVPPVIFDIKILNAQFTILGEVNNPGVFKFLKNNLDIFEAIGFAGGMTINGVRNSVKVIRNESDGKKVYEIDLTSINANQSPFFQIFSGDIIIVNPNSARVKNAGIIGNSGTLLSLLSFILSSIIVISN